MLLYFVLMKKLEFVLSICFIQPLTNESSMIDYDINKHLISKTYYKPKLHDFFAIEA